MGRAMSSAICAVAASMLTAIYHMLKDGTAVAPRLKPGAWPLIAKLGYQVELRPLPEAA